MTEITVNASSKTYPVLIGEGLSAKVFETAAGKGLGIKKAAVITDDIVGPLYADRVLSSAQKCGAEAVIKVIRNGEQSKNAANYIDILEFLAENHMHRNDAVIALGGGVIGDMAGFAAATYMRGMKLIQVPTTLLACVDSSVGGKTAIDLKKGKNLAGSFYQPEMVICDPETLTTLKEEEFRCGMAEVIKYTAIADRDLFLKLEGGNDDLPGTIKRCVEIKRDVVSEDECETGIRKILNFGHTFGHAVEKCSGFTLKHGDCVAIGMAMMIRACIKRSLCNEGEAERFIKLIERFGLPTEVPGYSAEELADAMLSDKKNMGSSITVVAFRSIGDCPLMELSPDEAAAMLREGI